MIEAVNWVVISLALFGAYLNSKQDRRGFYCWVVTNAYLMAYNLFNEQWPQGVLFGAYLLISINGLISWKDKK